MCNLDFPSRRLTLKITRLLSSDLFSILCKHFSLVFKIDKRYNHITMPTRKIFSLLAGYCRTWAAFEPRRPRPIILILPVVCRVNINIKPQTVGEYRAQRFEGLNFCARQTL
jgi:hypothetical protein